MINRNMHSWTSANMTNSRPFQIGGTVSDSDRVLAQTLVLAVPSYAPYEVDVNAPTMRWMRWCVLESATSDFILKFPSAADIVRYALEPLGLAGAGVFLRFTMINRSGFTATLEGGAGTTIDGRLDTTVNTRDTTVVGVYVTDSRPGTEEVTIINL